MLYELGVSFGAVVVRCAGCPTVGENSSLIITLGTIVHWPSFGSVGPVITEYTIGDPRMDLH